MDEDYKEYSQEKQKVFDKLGISYVWRDSCVDILVELRTCMKNDYLSYFTVLDSFSICKGIQKLWKECQYNRESKLLNTYLSKFEIIEKEIINKKASSVKL